MSHIFNNAEPGSQLIWTVMIPCINLGWQPTKKIEPSTTTLKRSLVGDFGFHANLRNMKFAAQ